MVWTTQDAAILLIKRDESWVANIDVLKDFYFLHIFPKITEGELLIFFVTALLCTYTI